jgi:DNA-binding response OmpR family regulator
MTPSARTKLQRAKPSRFRLMVVDNGRLVASLGDALDDGGFRVEYATNPERALENVRGQRYEVILINGDSAKVDPLGLCVALRRQGCLSAIVIASEAASEADEVNALRAGANEQIARAIPERTFVERLLAHMAGARIRATGLLYPATADVRTRATMITMSFVPTIVKGDDRLVSFTRIEERLFARLWAAREAVVAFDELVAAAWLGRPVGQPTLQVHVHHLRRKLGKLGLVIERVTGRGYRLLRS